MYRLGSSSLKELQGVHPRLVTVVTHAIGLTLQDFTVYDGARTLTEQKEYVRRGTSKTLKSHHLVQKDGFGHAVDLVPWINGKARWEWGKAGNSPIARIAVAMGRAAGELDVEIIWGGVWDRPMSSYTHVDERQVWAALEAYKIRHAGSDFLDGPHFELA